MSNKNSSSEKTLSFEKLRKITETRTARVHFVGVGGVSMFSLARLALLGKVKISGSDREDSKRVRELASLGVEVMIGHKKENVQNVEL